MPKFLASTKMKVRSAALIVSDTWPTSLVVYDGGSHEDIEKRSEKVYSVILMVRFHC